MAEPLAKVLMQEGRMTQQYGFTATKSTILPFPTQMVSTGLAPKISTLMQIISALNPATTEKQRCPDQPRRLSHELLSSSVLGRVRMESNPNLPRDDQRALSQIGRRIYGTHPTPCERYVTCCVGRPIYLTRSRATEHPQGVLGTRESVVRTIYREDLFCV